MKLGYIDYLNCYPFYYHMFEHAPVPGVEIIPGHPGDLNRMIKEGQLDMSPISSAAYAEMQEQLLVIPDVCLSSVGYVRSVVLKSKYPIEELGGKRVGLSSASKTSVNLLKILLEKYYSLSPEYIQSDIRPTLNTLDAALIIGNEAMTDSEKVPYSYDLGELWLNKTGHPVVFALFTVHKEIVSTSQDTINSICQSYHKSLQALKAEAPDFIRSANKKYPDITEDINTYFSLLHYHMTSELVTALRFYYAEAALLSLLPGVSDINFYQGGNNRQ